MFCLRSLSKTVAHTHTYGSLYSLSQESDGPLTEKNQNASGKKRAIEKEESGVVKLVKEITRNEKGNDKEESFVDNGNEDKDHAAKAGDDKNCFGVFDVGSFGFRFC